MPSGFVKTKRGGGEVCESQLSSALKGRIVAKICKGGKVPEMLSRKQKKKSFVAILI